MNELIKSINIYNSLGQEVLTKSNLNFLDNPISIDTNSFTEGIYFVQIIGEDDRVGVKKLIVQK